MYIQISKEMDNTRILYLGKYSLYPLRTLAVSTVENESLLTLIV